MKKIPPFNRQNASKWMTVIFIFLLMIYGYWHHAKYHPSTDNAYVGANVVEIASQVTGPVSAVYVKEYDTVKKNQPLFDIDPALFQVALDHAQSQLDLTKQNVEALSDTVQEAKYSVAQRASELKLAQQTYERINKLVQKRLISLAEGDKATRDLQVANGALQESNQKLQEVTAHLGVNDQKNAEIRAAEAQFNQAKLNLNYTHITSPTDGYIVNLKTREGTMVQQGITCFAIVDSSQWWIDANFKETDLERIRPGQHAKITVDIYPGHTFHGIVQNISRGSGAAFSIFPAENATGNWVKVTQRFPVRIYIKDPDAKFPLRIGASSTVTIDT